MDIFQTLASLAGIKPADALEGYDFSPVLKAGGVAPPTWRTAAFSQYPRCQNSTIANQPPYHSVQHSCTGNMYTLCVSSKNGKEPLTHLDIGRESQ